MWWIIIFSSLCLALTYLQDKGQMKRGMLYGFTIMTAFLSIRYNYGNDFMTYVDIFNDVRVLDWDELDRLTRYNEIGWLVLCKVFSPLGFQWLILFHTIFVFTTFYYLINKYVPRGWKWLAVFFFLFNCNILVIYLSMLQQSLAICCFLIAVDKALDKKVLYMVLWSALAYFSHRSAIISFPFVLFAYTSSSWIIVLTSVFSIGLMVSMIVDSSIAANLLSYALSNIDLLGNAYEDYTEGEKMGSGLGLIAEAIVFLPVAKYYKKLSLVEKVIVFLFFVNIVVFPLQYIILLFARVRYYFAVFGTLAIPMIMNKTKTKVIRNTIIAITVFITFWNYWGFFHSATFYKNFYIFHTIF